MRILIVLLAVLAMASTASPAAARHVADRQHARETRWLAPEVPTPEPRLIAPAASSAVVEPPPPAPEPAHSRWDILAECESQGQWDYNEHSGWGSGLYDGGLQFDPDTWTAFGGGQYAPTADRATRTQQIAIAEKVLAAQGWRAWPACTRELGWR